MKARIVQRDDMPPQLVLQADNDFEADALEIFHELQGTAKMGEVITFNAVSAPSYERALIILFDDAVYAAEPEQGDGADD